MRFNDVSINYGKVIDKYYVLHGDKIFPAAFRTSSEIAVCIQKIKPTRILQDADFVANSPKASKSSMSGK